LPADFLRVFSTSRHLSYCVTSETNQPATMATRKTKATKEQRPPASLNNADWRYSKAKQLVSQDLIDGLIPLEGHFDAKEIFKEHYEGHEFFKNFPFDQERYTARIERIRKAIAKLQTWAEYDSQKLLEDLAKQPRPEKNIRGELRWDGSEAQELLKLDMEHGLHLQMKPSKLRDTRAAYKLFGIRVFQQHIDQAKTAAKDYDEVTKSRRYKSLKLGDKSLRRSNNSTTS